MELMTGLYLVLDKSLPQLIKATYIVSKNQGGGYFFFTARAGLRICSSLTLYFAYNEAAWPKVLKISFRIFSGT